MKEIKQGIHSSFIGATQDITGICVIFIEAAQGPICSLAVMFFFFICFHLDAVSSNIRIDSRGPEVMRITPRLNETLMKNGYPTKHVSYDGLKRQRFNDPMVRCPDGFIARYSFGFSSMSKFMNFRASSTSRARER
ncbi:hypothetical protein MKW98_021844 [Papaver atlanticum]|uniref:4Fe-4S Mo/W bis-MGD-type domain-containing protein n=1 Tax=Papaver atlanticum TaxID=357466 RepID=A0AAD4SFY5_9MAGN|nr:hypothetical protein MKW98_021844 [Papaver atlanticum]